MELVISEQNEILAEQNKIFGYGTKGVHDVSVTEPNESEFRIAGTPPHWLTLGSVPENFVLFPLLPIKMGTSRSVPA